jgi:hypothetical protein
VGEQRSRMERNGPYLRRDGQKRTELDGAGQSSMELDRARWSWTELERIERRWPEGCLSATLCRASVATCTGMLPEESVEDPAIGSAV